MAVSRHRCRPEASPDLYTKNASVWVKRTRPSSPGDGAGGGVGGGPRPRCCLRLSLHSLHSGAAELLPRFPIAAGVRHEPPRSCSELPRTTELKESRIRRTCSRGWGWGVHPRTTQYAFYQRPQCVVTSSSLCLIPRSRGPGPPAPPTPGPRLLFFLHPNCAGTPARERGRGT